VKKLFLVELWRETAENDALGPWRGIVKHVAHDDEHYVVELSDIATFIAWAIGLDSPRGDDSSPSDTIRTPRF